MTRHLAAAIACIVATYASAQSDVGDLLYDLRTAKQTASAMQEQTQEADKVAADADPTVAEAAPEHPAAAPEQKPVPEAAPTPAASEQGDRKSVV